MTTTLRLFALNRLAIEPSTAWYLNDLGELRGKQELYTQQAPQRLKALRESAMVESALSSNRIEGVSVDPQRVRDVLAAPRPIFRDRDEEEVRGYRDALELIHQQARDLSISQETVCRLHGLARGQIWDAGQYKSKDSDIIERYPNGSERIRFRTVKALDTEAAMASLIHDWQSCRAERWIPPLLALAAFNLDFLCIHPFRDGNGRVSRLLWLLQSLQLGYEVGRYISLERLVEQNKDRYYETLEESSRGWHTAEHNPWPYIHYVLSIMKEAYRDFVDRVGEIKAPRGEKREMVLNGIERLLAKPGSACKISELEQVCPSVSRDMIRHVLREQQSRGIIACSGRGAGATWSRGGVQG
ncbi:MULTISPECIES: Fic family protein [Thiorhodovibrio]|uniref:Fic family protein n=1 Tax=Thiorhodovibrio TaxID=61593 RepID=UPI00191389D5|nr:MULTISPECIES: Fic family protein [Thiorhodovibrio]MBK5967747.1 cell filamentation protein Fic [Thiorhodovibrio winogradskyi]WPL14021.1 Fic/DOC family protein [Thiorhodovibrio litoralis]